MELRITFPGGKKVDAQVRERTIKTDQPPEHGGDGTAPEPFTLFAASLGTCAGLYALGFCQARSLETEGLMIRERLQFDDKRQLSAVELDIELPRGFPEKYREPLIRATEGCAVKKAIQAQPRFIVRTLPTATAN